MIRCISMYTSVVLVALVVAGCSTEPWVETEPTAEGYLRQASIYRSKGQIDQAITYYDKSLELDPSNAAAYWNKAQLCRFTGRKQEAIEAYRGYLRWCVPPDDVFAEDARRIIARLEGKEPATTELTLEEIIKRLRSPNPRIRADAVQVLGKSGNKEAIPALIEALDDENFTIRGMVAQALGQLRAVEAIPALIDILETDGRYIINSRIAPRDLPQDPIWQVVKALADIGEPSASEPLSKFLVQPLLPKLAHQEKNIIAKHKTIYIIGELGPKFKQVVAPAIPKLIDLLGRRSYVGTIGVSGDVMYGYHDDIPPTGILGLNLTYTGSIAAQALEKATGQNFGENQIKWRSWWESHRQDFEPSAR
jgi:hypothetical protein